MCYRQINTFASLFAVSKDEWDTKEDTGKSMKNALVCTAVCQKTSVRLNQSDDEQ